ncbi:MAG: hypothetical protein LBP53_04395 [Candidatus Peribacteria bacterium]|nr:hypothetical protein [Candidatus Peribacteria bacterium]
MYTGHIAIIGGAKIGNTTAGCSASNAGTLKYVDRCLSYCNGNNWTQVSCVTYSWNMSSYGSCSATSPTISSR